MAESPKTQQSLNHSELYSDRNLFAASLLCWPTDLQCQRAGGPK